MIFEKGVRLCIIVLVLLSEPGAGAEWSRICASRSLSTTSNSGNVSHRSVFASGLYQRTLAPTAGHHQFACQVTGTRGRTRPPQGCTKTPHPLWLDVSTCGLANSADLADRHTISFRSAARQPYNETFIFNLSHNLYDTEYLSTFVGRDC